MVGNVIAKCELFPTSIFKFLRPQQNMKFIHGGHFKNLKKSLAHFYIVGDVIVKYE